MRTPADIVASLIGYGRKRKGTTKKTSKKLTKQLNLTLDDLLAIPGTSRTTTSSVWSTGSPVETAMGNAMDRFMASAKNSPFPREQSYNKNKSPKKPTATTRLRKATQKKPTRAKKTVRKSRKKTITKKKTNALIKAKPRGRTAHETAMVSASTRYLQSAKNKTSRWLVI